MKYVKFRKSNEQKLNEEKLDEIEKLVLESIDFYSKDIGKKKLIKINVSLEVFKYLNIDYELGKHGQVFFCDKKIQYWCSTEHWKDGFVGFNDGKGDGIWDFLKYMKYNHYLDFDFKDLIKI